MIVAINGKQRSGKNSLAELIGPPLGLKLVGFADELKLEYAKLIGLPEPQDDKAKELIIDAVNHLKNSQPIHRTGLIELAESEKEKDPYIWAKRLLEANPDNICIYDMRFMVEIETLKPLGAFLIRVNRDRQLRAKGYTLSNEDHYGEVGLDDYKGWDFIVDNNGDKQELEDSAQIIITELNNSKQE